MLEQPPAPAGDFLYAVASGSDRLVKVDPGTGLVSVVGNLRLNLGDIEDIALLRPGEAVGVYWEGYPGLLRIDLKTGRGKLGPKIAGGSLHDRSFVEAIAVVDGELYGSASSRDSFCPDCADRLVRIEPETGHVIDIGKFGPETLNVEAMAYSPKYGLIGADIGTLTPPEFHGFHTMPSLVKIDPATGQATKIGDLPPSMVDLVKEPDNPQISPRGPYVCALSFSPDGTLYGAAMPTHFGGLSRLFVINPNTAGVFDVGPMNAMMVMGLLYQKAEGANAQTSPPKEVASTPESPGARPAISRDNRRRRANPPRRRNADDSRLDRRARV